METQLFSRGAGGVAHIAASLCENTGWSGNTQTHHQGHNQHFHLSICCCSAAPSPHICPAQRGRRANAFVAFSSKRVLSAFWSLPLCAPLPRFSPSQPGRLFLALPLSAGCCARIQLSASCLSLPSVCLSIIISAFCGEPEVIIIISRSHPRSPTHPPLFMTSPNPVSLCDEPAACCCEVDRNFGMAGAPPRLQPGSLSLPQRRSGFTETCRREMRASLSSRARRSLVLPCTPDVQLLTGQPRPTGSRPSIRPELHRVTGGTDGEPSVPRC